MSLWAGVIALLSFLLVLGSIIHWEDFYQNIISYMILLVSLAVLHRVWRKTKTGRFELLLDELEDLKEENRELREELNKME